MADIRTGPASSLRVLANDFIRLFLNQNSDKFALGDGNGTELNRGPFFLKANIKVLLISPCFLYPFGVNTNQLSHFNKFLPFVGNHMAHDHASVGAVHIINVNHLYFWLDSCNIVIPGFRLRDYTGKFRSDILLHYRIAYFFIESVLVNLSACESHQCCTDLHVFINVSVSEDKRTKDCRADVSTLSIKNP